MLVFLSIIWSKSSPKCRYPFSCTCWGLGRVTAPLTDFPGSCCTATSEGQESNNAWYHEKPGVERVRLSCAEWVNLAEIQIVSYHQDGLQLSRQQPWCQMEMAIEQWYKLGWRNVALKSFRSIFLPQLIQQCSVWGCFIFVLSKKLHVLNSPTILQVQEHWLALALAQFQLWVKPGISADHPMVGVTSLNLRLTSRITQSGKLTGIKDVSAGRVTPFFGNEDALTDSSRWILRRTTLYLSCMPNLQWKDKKSTACSWLIFSMSLLFALLSVYARKIAHWKVK